MQNYILDRQRLILCREKNHLTKQEAAKRMLMSQPAYLRYESGDRMPSIHIIQTMASVLGTSVEYLTGKTEDAHPNAYWVEASKEPELYSMIELYRSSKKDDQRRFLAYLKEFDKRSDNL